jgi:hypothetical protein
LCAQHASQPASLLATQLQYKLPFVKRLRSHNWVGLFCCHWQGP